jgi:hypothetical protein
MSSNATVSAPASPQQIRRARLKMLAILAVCAAPVIASYLTYYVIKPEGRTNYGSLIEPQRDIGALPLMSPDGKLTSIGDLRGKWLLLAIEPGVCAKACTDHLYALRQIRLTTGKDRDRVERVLLVTGDALPSAQVLAEYEGTVVGRLRADLVERTFPAEAGARADEHLYVIDPLGNLMMRFPRDVDLTRMKKDVAKLLRASRIG